VPTFGLTPFISERKNFPVMWRTAPSFDCGSATSAKLSLVSSKTAFHKIVDDGAEFIYAGGMNTNDDFEIFLVASPGTEAGLYAEALSLNFMKPVLVTGGVTVQGGWPEVWRANLELRAVTRVLARIGSFHAIHLSQLDKLSRKFPWGQFLRKDVPVNVEVTCKKSRIYHAGAAAQRIETALREEFGVTISADADVCIKARIENNLCTISIDTSGESLHKRGHKEAIGKAPMRETLATHFLRRCQYDGTETVVDPMCGSGTFVIEAAEMALGLQPGRGRDFAFEQLKNFDAAVWQNMRHTTATKKSALRFFGSDRDAGAIRMSIANAERSGVANMIEFKQQAVSDLMPPTGEPGLVIVNPPYGTRISDKKPLFALYGALGQTLLKRFSGWRVGLVTTDSSLAKATGLPFSAPDGPVNHGGLRVLLFQTQKLV
jgi:putative N6-adenine-specific DNA methylase